jgi:TIR domain
MAQIFISWSTPDRVFVNRIAERLEQEGFTVDEYSRDPTGGSIRRNVYRYVQNAELALVCLSAASVNADWIRREVTYCEVRNIECGLPEIIPLILDKPNVPEAQWPAQLREGDLRKFYLSAVPDDTEINKILETVSKTLRGEMRRVVPSVLLAYNREEADLALEKPNVREVLEPLCRTVGMRWEDGGKDLLLQRYGAAAEDFAPFPSDGGGSVKIKDLVQTALRVANRERGRTAKKPPLGIWWCTEEISDPNDPDRDRAVQLWRTGSSILVIDSISLVDTDSPLYDQFRDLPDPDNAATSALLWVPPYTLHTVLLEQVTAETLRPLNRLFDKFTRWNREPSPPYLAFDIGTRPTLRHWLHATFYHADIELLPDADVIAAMRQSPGGNQQLTAFGK